MSDDLCTVQGVVLGRARNRFAEARLDRRLNPFNRVEASIRWTTCVPAKVVLGRARSRSTEARPDRWRNPYSRVEAPNRLMTYVLA